MKILVLTVSDQQHHPLHQYTDLHRIYDFKNWIEGFRELAHDCFFFDYYRSFVEDGPRVMEDKIFDFVRNKNIDFVIIPNIYYEIGVRFLNKLKQYAVKSIMVFFDDSSRFETTNRLYVGLCDYIVTHESADALRFYEKYPVRTDFFPCYPSYNYYQNTMQQSADDLTQTLGVCFIGARIADRETYIRTLQSAGISLTVYGKDWPNGMISQNKMVHIFAKSKISLNFTKSAPQNGSRQLKARAFEIVMSGGFLLSEHDDELTYYFDVGTEIDTFRSAEECISKIRFFLKNPDIRSAMQEKAYNKAKTIYSLEAAWTRYLNGLIRA